MGDFKHRYSVGRVLKIVPAQPKKEGSSAPLSDMETRYALSQLLIGNEYPDEPLAAAALEALRPVEGQLKCRLLLVTIDKFHKLCQQHPAKERHRITEAVIDTAQAFCARTFRAKAVCVDHPAKFVVILSSTQDLWEPHSRHQWDVWFGTLCQEIEQKTGLMVSAVLSIERDGFDALPEMYRQVTNAITHKIFYPPRTMLFAEDIIAFQEKYYVYPVKEEGWMSRAIMRGNPEKAKELIREIIMSSKKYAPAVINMVVYRLAIALADIIDELQKGDFLAFPIQIPNSVLGALNLSEFESVEEIIAIFNDTAVAIINSLNSKRGEHHEEILLVVQKYIEENYCHYDCCMENAANLVGLSPAYVGRIFKRYMLISIAECILATRLERAKTLLLENPKMTVAQIANATGFADVSYFCKVFKKTCGVTPNVYRKGSRSEKTG